eukprot:2321983-Karenia_brevis.AAC.1
MDQRVKKIAKELRNQGRPSPKPRRNHTLRFENKGYPSQLLGFLFDAPTGWDGMGWGGMGRHGMGMV